MKTFLDVSVFLCVPVRVSISVVNYLYQSNLWRERLLGVSPQQ